MSGPFLAAAITAKSARVGSSEPVSTSCRLWSGDVERVPPRHRPYGSFLPADFKPVAGFAFGALLVDEDPRAAEHRDERAAPRALRRRAVHLVRAGAGLRRVAMEVLEQQHPVRDLRR